jgi:hypothetical protein
VVVSPADTTIAVTQTAQMRVVVTDINGHVIANPLVTWSSIPSRRVSATGLVTPRPFDVDGVIVVSATSGDAFASASVNVTGPPEQGSTITAAHPEAPRSSAPTAAAPPSVSSVRSVPP